MRRPVRTIDSDVEENGTMSSGTNKGNEISKLDESMPLGPQIPIGLRGRQEPHVPPIASTQHLYY
jgi:hypothetical protein